MKKINNEKGSINVWFIVIVFVFLGIAILVMDFGSLYMNNKTVKESLNRAVKAAALAINSNEQLAEGFFSIDPSGAEINFKQILAENIGLNEITLEPLTTGSLVTEKPEIKEFIVQNTTPTTYYSLVLKNYFDFKYPSVLAVIQVKIKGVFASQTFTLFKLSSSQLTSVYD
nr:hypothetical protein [Sedimentibacter sp.]